MKLWRTPLLAVGVCMLTAAPTATAQVFTGRDDNPADAASLPNSDAAAAAFAIAAATPLTTVDFENVPVLSQTPLAAGNLTIDGTGLFGDRPVVLDGTFCTFALCGANVTPGGSRYLNILGGTVTLSFATAVDALGFYLLGVQAPHVVTFFDADGSHEVTVDGVGSAFYIGFVGNGITTATLAAGNDLLGLDDISFTSTDVPEPATWAMMIGGIGTAGAALRRRARKLRLA